MGFDEILLDREHRNPGTTMGGYLLQNMRSYLLYPCREPNQCPLIPSMHHPVSASGPAQYLATSMLWYLFTTFFHCSHAQKCITNYPHIFNHTGFIEISTQVALTIQTKIELTHSVNVQRCKSYTLHASFKFSSFVFHAVILKHTPAYTIKKLV